LTPPDVLLDIDLLNAVSLRLLSFVSPAGDLSLRLYRADDWQVSGDQVPSPQFLALHS
jgi:hypothetical protein